MIRKVTPEDYEIFVRMTRELHNSPAVLHTLPESYDEACWEELMRSDDYIEGYILEHEGVPAGYALTAKMWQHEAGGLVLWIDELYVREAFRSRGLGREFFAYIRENHDPAVVRLRLEVEASNERAKRLYEQLGFEALPYEQMIKIREDRIQ